MAAESSTENTVKFETPLAGKPCETWYRIIGNVKSSSQPAIVALHGGPGSGHDYMVALGSLYEKHGFPIVLYDQIGCGRSTHLPEKMGDTEFWAFDLFIKELDNLIDHLQLRDTGFHLVGQSWGGMLAAAYACRRPDGLKKIVLSSAPASMSRYNQACQHRLAELPPKVHEILTSDEIDHASPEFQRASDVFMTAFVCQLKPVPDPVRRAWKNLKETPSAYRTMVGYEEFACKDAHKIEAETLLLNGRNDEVMDFVMKPWFDEIKKVKWVTLEKASHTLIWEEQPRFLHLCGEFLLGPTHQE
ncbi:Alpha/Beta hydrolase protein [Xylariaceae sp. FL0255]|nr:Alpha/Beta hydrolase protein [Xylariaceae sp. FL0255]